MKKVFDLIRHPSQIKTKIIKYLHVLAVLFWAYKLIKKLFHKKEDVKA